ncbi:type II secretion system protein [Paludisphaera borealis]|uniref:Type II secretion system protein G n=1 Tax=Paludisphaera borealis TaxID=1387353 RepID=A0A1U7CUN1_9BACT|nr:prepilin-type N-terminal cleavage/methylation domain-containing protein [Paludisphaera borealis]APW62599.1 Type II secretion system protein G [Paludisphaera borealis]
MNSPSTRARSPLAPRRRGFTLVELLVVIVIIAILIALLLPAINGAVRTAKVAAASAEINQIAQALAQFKAQYGVDPPSRIVLSETGNYSPAYLGNTLAPLGPRSVSYLRRIWPKMTLSTTGPLSASQIPGGWYDFNGDNKAPTIANGLLTSGQIHVLDGAECLVFFLGGLPGIVDGAYTTTGFSKNPSNPAINSNITPLGANRSSPTFEFRPGRLNDNYPVFANGTTGNGFPEYSDNLSASGTPQPFVYFSSYEGAGYDPDDVNYAEEGALKDGTVVNATWAATGQPSSGIGSIFFNEVNGSFAPNPYTNGAPIVSTGNTVNPEYINKNSFQIISAGIDGQFGPGGGYKANATDPLVFNAAAAMPVNLAPSMRQREQDNVTNFKGGRLD